MSKQQLSMVLLMTLFSLILYINGIEIPVINNARLIPITYWNGTILFNKSCDDCLCIAVPGNYPAVNCFTNSSCQLFTAIPIRYTIEQRSDSKLCFSNQVLPNASQCCMPNLTDVLNRLQNSVPSIANVKGPRCLTLDDADRIVTVETSVPAINRFNASNMMNISRDQPTSGRTYKSVTYRNGYYFIGLNNGSILVLNNTDLDIVNTITPSTVSSGLRDMIFLDDGRLLVAAYSGSSRLTFFNQSSPSSIHYEFYYQQTVDCTSPHGMWKVNDYLFYVTSWSKNQICSFTRVNDTLWIETLVIDAKPMAPISDGNHIAIDECGRFWFGLGNAGVLIFDQQGLFIGNFSFPSTFVFDLFLTNDYILYLSSYSSNRILSYDPQISC